MAVALRLLCMLSVAAILLNACAGKSQPAVDAGGPGALPAPVQLAPQLPQERAGAFNLPAPSALLAQYGARSASYAISDLTRLGADYALASYPNQRVQVDGGRAVLTPAYSTDLGRTFANTAYAIWPFQLEGYDLSGSLMLNWATPPGDDAQVWVGFSNFTRDRWDWYACGGRGVATAGFGDYIEAAQHTMLVAVIMLGAEQAALDTLRIGSGISGAVVDLAGDPVAYASIILPGAAPAMADELGRFTLLGLAAAPRLVVKVEAPGFLPTFRIYEVVAGAERFQRITLMPSGPVVDVDAATGGEIALAGGGTLTLPPGALVDHNSAPLSGTLQARLVYLDPSDAAQFAAAPGDWEARQQDLSEPHLQSYGVAALDINDGTGVKAQLAAGQTATLKLPIPAAWQAAAPAQIGLYTFDETEGIWLEETAKAVKDGPGQFYEAQLSHFSFINFDDWALEASTSCMRVKVVQPDGVTPAPGAYVNAGYVDMGTANRGWTNAEGIACLNVLHNSDSEILAYRIDYTSLLTPVHTPTPSITCEEGEGGCPLIATLVLQAPPVARVKATPRKGNPPFDVAFDASASTGATSLTYKWDWDGEYGGYHWEDSGASPLRSHSFDQLGSYCATVRVSDTHGMQSLAGVWIRAVRDPVGQGRSAWWMFGRDPLHTHRAGYSGPQTAAFKWQLSNGGNTSLVMGGDRELYAGNGTKLQAITPDGTADWEYDCGETVQTTPALDETGRIYFATQAGKALCVNPDGTLAWSTTLAAGKYIAGSPAIAPDGTVYFGCSDYALYALHPDGTVAWSYATGGECDVAPCIGPEGNIYCASGDFKVYALSSTGSLLWNYATGDFISSALSVADDGTVYAGSLDGYLYALDPQADDANRLKWKYNTSSMVDCGPAIGKDGTVYFGSMDNYLHAVSADGTLQWQFKAGDWIVGSPAIATDGMLYVPSLDGNLYALQPNGWLVWKLDAGAGIFSSPMLGPDGTLYLTAGSTVCAVGP